MEHVFIREKYLNKVKPYIGKNIIKILSGQRRVGKTTILKIEDYYEKIVVSVDEFSEDYMGIRHMHITQFLLT